MRRLPLAALAAALPAALVVTALPAAQAAPRATDKVPTAVGTGGAVATVDPEATRVGLEVLRKGGNAVDAAVAAAATLGVTEPYSAGIGGGGFFVYYDAAGGEVHTIDGRETAPRAMRADSFVENGTPIPFPDAVSSGLSVGVPGTPLTWQRALDEWGSISLAEALRPATQVASRGFVVDETFRSQTAANAARFADFTSTAELFLPGGQPPRVGTLFRNLDLAHTYRLMSQRGLGVLYGGELGREVVATVKNPPVAPNVTRTVRSGLMELSDLRAYTAPLREPTVSSYRGLDVYGMGVPSSGGIAVGETLNILEGYDLGAMDTTTALHAWFEASALAFADRNRYVGDVPGVPVAELLSQGFADERRCQISLDAAAPKPVAPGVPDGVYAGCGTPATVGAAQADGVSTTHLSTADRWGNVVSYTLTIEATGGSGIVVPGRGFLLNNELTDFNFTPTQGTEPDPNLPGPGKRPRSSMSPTIVLQDGEPLLAVGSPGGATIITTVEQVLVGRLDLGLSLPEAVAAPRASQRNTPNTNAEQAFLDAYGPALRDLGHSFAPPAEIGAVAALEFLPDGRVLAAAEPVRRGGGSAGVVRPG
ncbi:MAG TPA: gamma-glutamyltransferase [Jiangellales bacterium]|nr:gamma-glutamyltransferase [Jiangellales bacterium]